jgi:hypothetical protein
VRLMTLAVLLALSRPLLSQAPATSLDVHVTASAEAFRAATEEYRDIWVKEGSRIVAAMERVTGLRFEPGPIEVSIYEGTSYSGARGGRPMLLRASYPTETKRGTLVHELAHRLAAEVPFYARGLTGTDSWSRSQVAVGREDSQLNTTAAPRRDAQRHD